MLKYESMEGKVPKTQIIANNTMTDTPTFNQGQYSQIKMMHEIMLQQKSSSNALGQSNSHSSVGPAAKLSHVESVASLGAKQFQDELMPIIEESKI